MNGDAKIFILGRWSFERINTCCKKLVMSMRVVLSYVRRNIDDRRPTVDGGETAMYTEGVV